jgi:dolichol-phosphate mannosyltransferase
MSAKRLLRAIELSVVCPCYNEMGNVAALLDRLVPVLAKMCDSYEIILVDDGSKDGTWDAILSAARTNRHIRGMRLSRNFSHQNALLAGLRQAGGAAVITMDSDLQHPPEVIPELVAAWRQGSQIVATQRQDKEVSSAFKRVTSRLFYRFFSFMAGIELNEGMSDFRLIDRRALDQLLAFAFRDRFLRGSVQWMGFRTSVVSYIAEPRYSGASKYNLPRMLRFAAIAITSFSNRPLRIGIWIGVIVGILALVELLYVVAMAIGGETVPGWASTVGVMSFLFAILFATLGVIGIYISRIYTLLQDRPEFVVSETVEFGQDGSGPKNNAGGRKPP